MKQIRKCI